jgi:hypoxanthine phosphoribosyltransferase
MAIRISWDEVEQAVENIADQIKKDGFEADCLIGITEGGIIPLGLLVKKMKIIKILTVSAKSYRKEEQGKLDITYLPEADLKEMKILLVDEIADTGETLGNISQIFADRYGAGEIRTAALVVNRKNCKLLPDYSALSADEWVVFPWDKDEFPEYFK